MKRSKLGIYFIFIFSIPWDFSKVLTNYNKHTRKIKEVSWRKFCEEIEEARLQKILSKDEPIMVGTLRNEDGNFTNAGREVMEMMAQIHFPGAKDNHSNDSLSSFYCLSKKRSQCDYAKSILIHNNARWAISTFKTS